MKCRSRRKDSLRWHMKYHEGAEIFPTRTYGEDGFDVRLLIDDRTYYIELNEGEARQLYKDLGEYLESEYVKGKKKGGQR